MGLGGERLLPALEKPVFIQGGEDFIPRPTLTRLGLVEVQIPHRVVGGNGPELVGIKRKHHLEALLGLG